MVTALFTAEEFDQMVELGAFGKRKVALVNGEIVDMSAQGEPHVISYSLTSAWAVKTFGDGWAVRLSSPLRTNRFSQPEPDVVVLRGNIRDHIDGTRPNTAELVIEISESTLRDDRTVMRKLYAKANVPEYWIVNLNDRQLEVFRTPNRRTGKYADYTIYRPGEVVSPLAAPDVRLDPAHLLP